MADNIADIVLHIDETLTPERLNLITDAIRELDGVVSAGAQEKTPHLVTVLYNHDNINSQEILAKVTQEGFHAELVGI